MKLKNRVIILETLVIGKPAINVYLPLQEFPQEGDIFTIKVKNESVGNVGASSSCLLAKWGVSTHFTGVVGNDAYAEKIKNTFKEYKVNSKYMETNFEYGTSVNYIILNSKTGNSSKILYNNPDVQLTKYKYDFIPGFAIIDGTDFAGAHALLNNNAACKTVFYARTADKDTINISKKCTWVVCTQTFAEGMTKIETDGTAGSYVNLYQKIVDMSGKSNYIVILNNHKILYSVDGKVKMLPEMKINVIDSSSFDSVFVGALAYGVGNSLNIDDAIKLANTAAGLSISKIGDVSAIPTLDEVLDNSGLKEIVKPSTSSTPTPAAEVTPLNPEAQKNLEMKDNSAATSEVNNNESVNVAFGTQPIANEQISPTPMPTPALNSVPSLETISQEVNQVAQSQTAPMPTPVQENNQTSLATPSVQTPSLEANQVPQSPTPIVSQENRDLPQSTQNLNAQVPQTNSSNVNSTDTQNV